LRLFSYVVRYKKLRGKASVKLLAEQLILAYAKQITSGMPEPVWRANMLTLINECEKEHEKEYQHDLERHKEIERKASQSQAGHIKQFQTVLRGTSKRKTFNGLTKERQAQSS